MTQFAFVGGSYTARSKSFDSQRTINLYPEASGSGTSKGVAALYGTPGLALWATLGEHRVRGLLRFTPDLAVAVAGGSVYTLTPAGAVKRIGDCTDGDTPVGMASNGQVVMLVTGPTGYVIDPVAGKVEPIASPEFTGADCVTFIDGYFAFNKRGTAQFQITGLYDTTIDPLAFATAEGAPDKLLALIANHRELWLFGETSTEVYFNSGNSDFPFERIQGAYLEVGCAAKFSVAKIDNALIWLAADERGHGMVMRASGYQPARISTHAIEYAIGQYERIDDAVAWAYQQEGHAFYVLSFPTADATWVFDASTNLWHERAWRDDAGRLHQHRAQCQMAFAGANIVGDREDGRLYRLDLDTYTDDGAPIPRIRSCPHIASDLKEQFFAALQIDMEAGVGLSEGQGREPQAMLQWSNDGGFTWGNELWASIGRIGERRARVRWRRLGRARDRVFKVTITEPVRVAIVGASVEMGVGAS